MTYQELRKIIDENGTKTVNILNAELIKAYPDNWNYYKFKNWEIQTHNDNIFFKSTTATNIRVEGIGKNSYTVKLIDEEHLEFSIDGIKNTVKIVKNDNFVYKINKKSISAIGGAKGLINAIANRMPFIDGFMEKAITI